MNGTAHFTASIPSPPFYHPAPSPHVHFPSVIYNNPNFEVPAPRKFLVEVIVTDVSVVLVAACVVKAELASTSSVGV